VAAGAAAPALPSDALTLKRVLLCSALIVTLSMGVRHGFGLFLQPVTLERGWTREAFAFALAVQNLAWGLAGPLVGGLADRFGAQRVLIAGAFCYAAGLVVMAVATTPFGFLVGAGLLVGVSQAGTTYAVAYGVIGRNVSPARRSWAMGVAASAGSFGQFAMVPIEGALIATIGWHGALLALAAMVLLIVPLAFFLREPASVLRGAGAAAGAASQSLAAAVREAFASPSFRWLTAGYFVCGFQVVFIGVHLPSYLKDQGLPAHVATTALMLIGLFNVFGTYAAGSLGGRMPKRFILSAIYFARAVVILAFLAAPLSAWSVYLFAATIGFLWLSTVPPTNGIVADIFGVRHLSMLGGFVFLSHQVGSFLGAWLGGRLYDATGSYDVVWWIAIGLGVFAGLANLPIREKPVARLAAA
jgi:MFS family permease